QFSVWCPKGIAMIGKLPATIEDRSVVIPMKRKTRNDKVQHAEFDKVFEETAGLRRKIARWRDDHLNEVKKANPSLPQDLHDRARDNWRPLLAVADVIGGDWPKAARDAAQALAVDGDSIGEQLLGDIREIFKEHGLLVKHSKDDRVLTTEMMVEQLVKIDDR